MREKSERKGRKPTMRDALSAVMGKLSLLVAEVEPPVNGALRAVDPVPYGDKRGEDVSGLVFRVKAPAIAMFEFVVEEVVEDSLDGIQDRGG